MNQFLYRYKENLHTVDISSMTYLPRLVNVACERPLVASACFLTTGEVTTRGVTIGKTLGKTNVKQTLVFHNGTVQARGPPINLFIGP